MKAAPKITAQEVRRHHDTRANYFTGTKEALIAEGICKAKWFPTALVPEFRKDGQPYVGNSGKQRMRRTYVVEGRTPETILTHRTDSEGQVYWVVSVAATDEERATREAKQEKEFEEQRRRFAQAQEERRRETERAAPLVRMLAHRYPTIGISGAIREFPVGTTQSISFYAPLDELKRVGLVREEMLACKDGDYYRGDLSSGEWFYLSPNDERCWGLSIHTPESPRERKHLDVREARQLLKRIAARG